MNTDKIFILSNCILCLFLNLLNKHFASIFALLKIVSQLSSVAQSCLTLCDPIDCSMPGLPVHHQLPELVWTHVYWISDAIQPSHPLSSRSSPSFNLSQHQGLFQSVSSSHQVAKVLEFQLQQHMTAFHVSTRCETTRQEWRISVLSHARVLPCSSSSFTDFMSYEFQTCLSSLLNHMS